MAHIAPGCDACLNLDEKMITRAPIVNPNSHLEMTQGCLDSVYLSYQWGTFNIINALLYQICSNIFMDMNAYVYMKQRKSMEDGEAMYLVVHHIFLTLTMWSGRLQRQKSLL